jgi:hypothetical protein
MSDESDGAPSGGRRAAQGADLIIQVLAAGFTIYFLADTWNLTWEAKANGLVIGTLLLALTAIQLVRMGLDAAAHRTSLRLGAFAERSPTQFQRLALVAILIIWLATISWLGTTLSLALVMAASMWVLGVRSWNTLAIASTGTAAGVYVLFILLLGSRLPHGIVEHLIARLSGGGT